MLSSLLLLQRCQTVCTTDQDEISLLELFIKKLINAIVMVKAGISGTLLFQKADVSDNFATGQRFTVNHRDDTTDPGAMTNFRPLKCLQQWFRQGETTGLDHDSIELVCLLQNRFHRWQEIILHRATKAAIG